MGARTFKVKSRKIGPFTTYGGLAENLIGEQTILAAVFQKGQLMPYHMYHGVS